MLNCVESRRVGWRRGADVGQGAGIHVARTTWPWEAASGRTRQREKCCVSKFREQLIAV